MSRVELVAPETAPIAPELAVTQWFNSNEDITLESLRGSVVALHAFQMLCPGCVSHGVPQAQKMQDTFGAEVKVIGIHTVFEHHAAMTPISLEAFLHEYHVRFPVGVDTPRKNSPIPQTMANFGMRGTPTLILIDAEGRVRFHAFGRPDDMQVGAAVATLVAEAQGAKVEVDDPTCDADGCRI